jgi:hypothetical protein
MDETHTRPRPVLRLSLALLVGFGLLIGAVPGSVIERVAAADDDDDDSRVTVQERNESGRNVVTIWNKKDGRMRIRGSIELDRVPGSTASPVNHAVATSSCIECQTMSVALQIALVPKDADRITPENAAVAVNYECTRCVTIARALQYVIQVDDPNEVPREVRELIREIDREMRDIARDDALTIWQANERVSAVIARFSSLAANLYELYDDEVGE